MPSEKIFQIGAAANDSLEANVKFHGGRCSGGKKRSRVRKKKKKRKAIFELENEQCYKKRVKTILLTHEEEMGYEFLKLHFL